MAYQPPPPGAYARPGGGAGAPGGFGPPPPFGGTLPPSYGGQMGGGGGFSSGMGGGGGGGGGMMGGGPSSRPMQQQPADDKLAKVRDPLLQAVKWVKSRSQKEKLAMGCVAGLLVSPYMRWYGVGVGLSGLLERAKVWSSSSNRTVAAAAAAAAAVDDCCCHLPPNPVFAPQRMLMMTLLQSPSYDRCCLPGARMALLRTRTHSLTAAAHINTCNTGAAHPLAHH